MSTLEKNSIMTICRMIHHCHNADNSPSVRKWALECGKRALLTWATLRTI